MHTHPNGIGTFRLPQSCNMHFTLRQTPTSRRRTWPENRSTLIHIRLPDTAEQPPSRTQNSSEMREAEERKVSSGKEVPTRRAAVIFNTPGVLREKGGIRW